MMQPYRLALTSSRSPSCADPPTRACESAEPRRAFSRFGLLEALMAGTLAIACGAGAYAGRTLGRGGHVEIGPNALAHVARVGHRLPARTSRAAASGRRAMPPSPSLTSQRALLAGEHDPKKLVVRAKTLESMGLDVTVVDVPMASTFSSALASRSDFWPTSWRPIYGAPATLTGFEIVGLPSTSPLRVAGFANGDQLLGVDGYDLSDGSLARIDADAVRKRGWLVAEIARADHHVILSIRWTPSP